MIPFEVYTHFSIQYAFAKPDELVAKAFDLKLPAIAITDLHSLSGSVEFLQEIEKANKKSDHKVKPIIGCTFIYKHQDTFHKVVLLCEHKNGYYNLCKLLARLDYDMYANQAFISLSDLNYLRGFLIAIVYNPDHYQLFEHQNKFIHTSNELIEGDNIIYGRPVFYSEPDELIYQQIIVCSKLKTTLKEMKESPDDFPDYYKKFFDGSEFHLRNDWTNNSSDKLLPLIESFTLQRNPQIPSYCEKPDELLRELCRKGWRNKLRNSLEKKVQDRYVARIEEELKTFTDAGLANYMLLVWDFLQFGHKNGVTMGLRGSAVGCLSSYLTDISDVDPMNPDPTLPYAPERELLFSRFYNVHRNTKDNISLPDIDIDMPINFRQKLIQYVQNKYGKDKVAHIITFSRMDGKGAIKEVFRVLEPVANSFDVANAITKDMVDTSKIQDILEDIKEENPDYNVIQYCIDNIPKIKEYYEEYKEIFDIAIRISSTIRNPGKHAAGIIINNGVISDYGPTCLDETTGELVLALEMADAEYCGFVKYDFLGVAAYEKMDQIMNMINNNLKTIEINEEQEYVAA